MEQFIIFSGDYSDNILVTQRVLSRIFPTGMVGFNLFTIATSFVLLLSSLGSRRRR